RGRAAEEDEEGGLKSVLGGVGVAQQPATDAQHHRAVPAHQRRERRLVALAGEAAQQLAVAGAVRRPDEPPDVPQHRVEWLVVHERPLPPRSTPKILPAAPPAISEIFARIAS